MDKLSLRIFLLGSLASFLEQLTQAQAPEFVSYTLESQGDAADIPNEHDTIAITHDLEEVRTLLDGTHDLTKIVYIGRTADYLSTIGAPTDQLIALWEPVDDEATRVWRLEMLIRQLKDAYDAWLYRNWLMSLIDSLPDIVWYKEASGLHNLVNKQFCATVHKTREDTKDRDHCYIWNAPPESAYQCAETDAAVMEGGTTVIADEKVETDLGMRQFRTYKSPVRGRDGSIIGTVGLGHDVTNFTNMGLELQILMDNLPYPVALADTNWRVISTNSRFREVFGFSEAEVEGIDYRAWKASLETEELDRVMPDGTHQKVTDYIFERADGIRHAYTVSEPSIIDYFDCESGHYCVFREVTAERAFERRAVEFANTDVLTGLANRRRNMHFLEARAGKALGLLSIDLDNFKLVNDTFGHSVGDDVLVRVSQIMLEHAFDGLVSRIGGDEFTCAIPGTWTVPELEERARLIQEQIEREFAYLNVGLSCSIGVTYAEELPCDIEAFLSEADERMYAIKAQHRCVR